MIAWEKVSLKEGTFVPQITGAVKAVQLQHFLIVFHYNGKPTEKIFAFDLKQRQWLKSKLTGDELNLKYESSVCAYDDNTIVLLGLSNDKKEDLLSILSLNKGSDEMLIYHDLASLQERLLRTHHSASILGDQMFIYGGTCKDKFSNSLSLIDLKTLKVTLDQPTSGKTPGALCIHSSLSQGDKIFLYGGGYLKVTSNQRTSGKTPGALYDYSSLSQGDKIFIYECGCREDLGSWNLNNNVYILETSSKTENSSLSLVESYQWTLVQPSSRVHSTLQVHKEKVYLFGGTRNDVSNQLSISHIGKDFRYEITRKGDAPRPSSGAFSAIYDNRMFIFGGMVESNGQHQEMKNIYALNLEKEMKPVNNFVKEIIEKRAFGFENANRDLEAIKEVEKMLEENKEPDIIFNVQGKHIPAHKEILMIRSSYFSNMFSSGMQESHEKEIMINDISLQAFEALIEFIYKGTLPSQNEILKELIVYSEKILLKRLKVHCERMLRDQMTKENVADLYELSKVSGAEELREASLQFISNNLSYFVDEFSSTVLAKQV